MFIAGWNGFLRFIATASLTVIAVSLLHIFMIPPAWYISFLLGFGTALLFVFCISIPLIVWWIGKPEDNVIDLELNEFVRFAPEIPENDCYYVARETQGGGLEFLAYWDYQALTDDACVMSDWFTFREDEAIVFDKGRQAIKVALALYLFDYINAFIVLSAYHRNQRNQHVFDKPSD